MPEFDPLRAKIDIEADDALRSMNGMIGAVGNFRVALGGAGAALVAFAGARGLASATKAAIEWERALTNVAKTVDGTEIQIAGLGKEILELSERIPLTSTELAELGEVAGQLGVELENIPGLIETAAALGVATNLSATEAATAVARLGAVLGTAEEDFDRIGAAVVDLGNNSRTTERDILEMAQRLAAAGRVIGLTEGEVLGFAAALSSVGIESEAGGTAFSKVFLEMQAAVQTGGAELQTFAELARVSVPEFAELFERDAAEAIARFIDGLSGIVRAGGNTSSVLETLGFQEVRVRNALLSSAAAAGEVTEQLDRGNRAIKENNALVEEAARFYGTTESQTRLLENQLGALKIQIGRDLLPVWRDLLTVASDFLGVIRDLNSTPLTLALPQEQASQLDQAIRELAKRQAEGGLSELDELSRLGARQTFLGQLLREMGQEGVADAINNLNLLGIGVSKLNEAATNAVVDDAVDELAQQIFDAASKLEGDLQAGFIELATTIVQTATTTEEASDRINAALGLLLPLQGLPELTVEIDAGESERKLNAVNEAFRDLINEIELNRIRLVEGDEAARRFELGLLGLSDAMIEAVIAGERLNEVLAQPAGLLDDAATTRTKLRLSELADLIGGPIGQALHRAVRDTDDWEAAVREVAQIMDGPLKRAVLSLVTANELNLEKVKPLPDVAGKIRDQWIEAARAAEEHRRQVIDTTRAIEAAARGAIDLGQAVGAIGPELASILTSATNLGSSISGILTSRKPVTDAEGKVVGSAFDLAGALPFFGGALGAAGNLLSTAFGESERQRKIRQATEANTVALERLRASIDTLADQLDRVAGETAGAIEDLAGSDLTIDPVDRFHRRGTVAGGIVEELGALGIDVSELEEIGRALDIPVDQLLRLLSGVSLSGEDILIAIAQFENLRQAARDSAEAGNSFSAQMARLRQEFELFDIDDPIEQLGRMRDMFLEFVELPDDIEAAIAGADLSTPEGRAAFEQALQRAFEALGLDREAAGRLSRDAAESFITEMERAADALEESAEGGAGGEGSEGFRSVRTITEVGANLMIAVLTTIAITLDQIKAIEAAQLTALGGTNPAGTGGQLPAGFGGQGDAAVFGRMETHLADILVAVERIADSVAPGAAGSIGAGTLQVNVHIDGQSIGVVEVDLGRVDSGLGTRRIDADFFSGRPRVIQ